MSQPHANELVTDWPRADLRPLWRAGAALACLYAPYSWLLFTGHPWNSYHRQWLAMWPVLPGLPAHLFQWVHRRDEAFGLLVMAGVTAAVVWLVVALSTRGPKTALATCVVTLILSGLNPLFAYSAYWF